MIEHKNIERQPLIARSMNLQLHVVSQQHSQNSEHEVSPILKRVLIESPAQKITDIETSLSKKTTKRTKHEQISKTKMLNQAYQASAEPWKVPSIEETNMKVREWQRQYRKAFPSFKFYFDSVDQNIKHKLTKQINKLGGTVETFFSKNITHVITTRPIPDFTDLSLQSARKSISNTNTTFSMSSTSDNRSRKIFGIGNILKDPYVAGKHNQDELLKNDILIKAHEYDMKIWSFDKFVNKILRSLLDPSLTPNQPKLSHLLYDEKVNGTRERDRTAPREDYVYFKGPYLFVRDISNIYRPIIIKEWPKPPNGRASEGEWPQFRVTSFGHCPFVRENYRKSHHPSSLSKHQVLKELQNIPEPSKNLKSVFFNCLKNDSHGIHNQIQSIHQADINASGIVQSNLTSAIRSQTSANARSGGMAGSITIPLSKSVDDLKRKVFIQVQQRRSIQENINTLQQSQIDPTDKKKIKIENKPGYCENCREKFEDFDKHINSRRHIKYATNDENFAELDELLSSLKRKRLPWIVEA
ncbi:hypothetical protein PORY_000443 [Pneumocystis oryctolagi]|uniref:Uncharacterized protein n=1 Tax=Pneumocystis oryctolagi TaxID=42067 RepID=A0ACB7CFW8_9ASCO|nr:hypothetical protein PORY_000443 [Pneumocystis oryctolagi]